MPETRTFSWKELSELKHESNAHVAYEGKVYDVSSFSSRHPGGVEQILAGAGRDITQVFKSYHKTDTFQRVLSKYYVGDLIDNEHPVFPKKESKFNDLLKQRVAIYLKTHNLDSKIDYQMFSIYFIVLILYFLSLYLFIIYHCNFMYSFGLTILRAFLSTMIGGTLHHDASHFSVTHKPRVWKYCKLVASCILGMSSCVWHYRHVIGHHSYTNIEGADPDIETGPNKNSKGVYRNKSTQPWNERFVYQHLYMPILYTLQTTVMKISDFKSITSLLIGNIRMNPLNANQMFEFWLSKFVHAVIHFVVPLCFVPFSHVMFFFAIFETAFSFIFVQLAQLNHVTNETSWPIPDKTTKQLDHDWAELQVATAQDYCTDSWFWTLFTGALNHQTAHHLFPGYIQSHYYWITPIVKQTCADMGIQYNSTDSMVDALGQHYTFLRKMGMNEHES